MYIYIYIYTHTHMVCLGKSSFPDLKARQSRQVVVTCSDCSAASAAFLAISCDSSVLPELTPTAG